MDPQDLCDDCVALLAANDGDETAIREAVEQCRDCDVSLGGPHQAVVNRARLENYRRGTVSGIGGQRR